jgi:sugar porter (SP) family MFS transporter
MSEVHKTLNKRLLATCVIASLGGLLFGFDTAVIAGTTGSLTSVFHLSPLALGFTVSSALWGTVLGAAFAGKMGDIAGRRACLRALGLLYVLTALGCALAWGWYPLLCFRVLAGLAVGGSSVISPTYIAEIAPPKLRGRLVMAFQFNVVFGMLLAYFSNFCLGLLHLGATDWRWKFSIAAVPALVFYLALFFIPESPRWLAGKGKTREALEVLQRNGDPDPELELREITKSLEDAIGSKGTNVFQWRYRFPIFLAISIGMFNQLSGINAILYYLNDIFAKAGFSKVSGDLQSVAIGATNLLFTMIAMSLIDRIGRKTLLLIGAVGTAVSLAGVAAIFFAGTHQELLVWCLVGFIASFAFSQGAVIWVYLSEVFPTRVRAKGQSLGSFTHWIMNALISAVFPVLAARSGGVPFVFFAVMMVVQFFVVLAVYPETKGYTLEEMQRKLGIS